MGLSTNVGFSPPLNTEKGHLEPPFLFYGFVPSANYSLNGTLGLTVNGVTLNYTNCGQYTYNHFALFTNFKEAKPGPSFYGLTKFCELLFAQHLPNPSGRVMPSEFFFFGETTWGGCGCHVQTNYLSDITGFTIGFR